MDRDKEIKFNMNFWEYLALLFIGLKLTHVINWSWWWVLAPIWIPISIILIIIVVLYFTGNLNKIF